MSDKQSTNNNIRLQKVIANSGYTSRRKAEELIKDGLVTVNGTIASLGQTVSTSDTIKIDGKKLKTSEEVETKLLVYNKPIGEICTSQYSEQDNTVFESLPPIKDGKWVLVGRLDVASSGLLLISNNGDLAHKLMHPSSNLKRSYYATVEGIPTKEELIQATKGIKDNGETLKLTKAKYIRKTDNAVIDVSLTSGKNREVRRIFEALGYNVLKLHRYQYGPYKLPKDLRIGDHAYVDSSLV